MGCCNSIPSSPYLEGSSSRAINSSQPQSQSALARPSTRGSNQTNVRHSDRLRSLARPIDRPLRRHVWTSKDRFWTGPELEDERTAFFDTRVTGRPEIWQTLRMVLGMLLIGGDTVETDEALTTAQQILTASEITVPSGNLADGAYDNLGVFYPLPDHIVSDPVNIVPANFSRTAGTAEGSEDTKKTSIIKSDTPEDRITIKARRSDGVGKDILITASRKDTIQVLNKKFREAAQLEPAKSLRLLYLGKVLRATESLETEGWTDGNMLNAMISE